MSRSEASGQMNPKFIPTLIRPIVEGRADYAKGNRFYLMEGLAGMPFVRLFGNLALSFASKLSSGVLMESLITPWKLIMRHGRIKAK